MHIAGRSYAEMAIIETVNKVKHIFGHKEHLYHSHRVGFSFWKGQRITEKMQRGIPVINLYVRKSFC